MMSRPRLPVLALPLVWCALVVLCSARIGRTMNQHGLRVMRHWEQFRPRAFAELDDPETFFVQAGEELETSISQLSTQLAGKDLPGEEYLQKVARLRSAHATATETAYAQSGLLEVETSREDWEDSSTLNLVGLQEWAWAMQAQLEGLEQTTYTFEETSAAYRLPVPFLQALVAAESPYEFLNVPGNRRVWDQSVEDRWKAFQNG